MLHNGLNRHVPRMTMEALAKFGATVPSAIPDLLEPQLLTFNSERGMMVVGFEEIAGVRYLPGVVDAVGQDESLAQTTPPTLGFHPALWQPASSGKPCPQLTKAKSASKVLRLRSR